MLTIEGLTAEGRVEMARWRTGAAIASSIVGRDCDRRVREWIQVEWATVKKTAPARRPSRLPR
jgi:hypothetical protein